MCGHRPSELMRGWWQFGHRIADLAFEVQGVSIQEGRIDQLHSCHDVRLMTGDGEMYSLDGSVLEQRLLDGGMEDCRLDIIVAFEFPCVPPLVMQ